MDLRASCPGGRALRLVLQSRTAASQPQWDDARSTSGQLLWLITAMTSVLTQHSYLLLARSGSLPSTEFLVPSSEPRAASCKPRTASSELRVTHNARRPCRRARPSAG